MKVMNVKGLTLYHLKSHLQKYRLGKQPQRDASLETTKEVEHSEASQGNKPSLDAAVAVRDEKEASEIANALKAQMEVQKKLQEQLEVQRRLQMRIEAQSRYLQSILEKAQAAFASQTTASAGLETARAELAELASDVTTECFMSPFPGLSLPSLPGLSHQLHLPMKSSRNDVVGLESQMTDPMSENLSASFAFTQNSTRGGIGDERSNKSKRLRAQYCDNSLELWQTGGRISNRHENNADDSQGSSARTEETLGNACISSKSELSWEEFSGNVSHDRMPSRVQSAQVIKTVNEKQAALANAPLLHHPAGQFPFVERSSMRVKIDSLQEELSTLYKEFETYSPSMMANRKEPAENAELNAVVEGAAFGRVESWS